MRAWSHLDDKEILPKTQQLTSIKVYHFLSITNTASSIINFKKGHLNILSILNCI